MVSDTAISGVGLEVRDREYQLKIMPSLDGGALIGFSGDAHLGSRIIQKAARLPATGETVAFLLNSLRGLPAVVNTMCIARLQSKRGADLCRVQ
jgi:hypothetical protein